MARARTFIPALTVLVTAGCLDAGPSDLGAPDPSKILVFFPVSDASSAISTRGLVRGRAFPGTFPSSDAVPFAVIRSHPSSLREAVIPVEPDGGFDFSIIASGRETLEIAGANARPPTQVGPSVYVEIPPVPVPPARFGCCRNEGALVGSCITTSDLEAFRNPVTQEFFGCEDDPRPVAQCESDRDCIVLSRRHYDLDEDDLRVIGPDQEGDVVVEGSPGAVVRNGLVLVENRRLNGIGQKSSVLRQSVIAEADGSFRTEPFGARGDDELVIEFLDVNDFRSPSRSLFVPDPPLESADILEVWPVSDLSTQLGGFIALRIFLTGDDGRGLCPDNPGASPAYCFSGGLTFDQVQIDRSFIDRPDQVVQLCPALAEGESPPPEAPCGGPGVERLVAPTARRGVEGDVRSGPQDIVIVVDLSANGANVDARSNYFVYLSEFVAQFRAGDRVGVSSFGARAWSNAGSNWSGLSTPAAARAVLEGLSTVTPEGGTDLFAAVVEAAERLDDASSAVRQGRIVVTSLSGQDSLPDESDPTSSFSRALSATQATASSRSGIPVDIVGLNLFEPPRGEGGEAERSETIRRLLDSLAAFSGPQGLPGRLFPLSSSANLLDLRLALRDVRGRYSGGFNLLYEVIKQESGIILGDQVGKLGELFIEATVSTPTGVVDTSYLGPLEFKKLITP